MQKFGTDFLQCFIKFNPKQLQAPKSPVTNNFGMQ